MKVLIVMMEDDYGDPSRGRSCEYYTWILTLRRLFPDTGHFDYKRRERAVGRAAMNAELVQLVKTVRPEVTIVGLYGNEFEPATIREIGQWTTTVGYFWDDIWRRSFSFYWARHFRVVTTADPEGVERFHAAGHRNVIYSPFSFNEEVFTRMALAPVHDVSFIGENHPYRSWIVDEVRRAGFKIATFGQRWPAGRISSEEMVRVFNTSKVSLNLSNSTHLGPRFLMRYPLALPRMLKHGKHHEQMKARHFEIAGCGAFQISYDVRFLPAFFTPGTEIETFRTVPELLRKIDHYLAHDDQRRTIAEQGWRRAQRDHRSTERLARLVSDSLAFARSTGPARALQDGARS